MTRLADANPILLKEMLSILRTKLFIRFLYLSTGVLALSVLVGGSTIAAGHLAPATVGQIVFQIFFTLALVVIILVAPAHAATFITGEREGRTYESLILSGMDAWRIVRGKFLASFASLSLVLVAFSPIVGIAFLFGGISPTHVFFAFLALFGALAVSVSFGIAISARLKTTRVAILIAFSLAVPSGMIFVPSLAGMGEAAHSAWGLGMHGPFWFAEALGERFFEWDTFALVFLLPTFLVTCATWFFLAAAMAGVRPAAEDRSTAFKGWSLYALVGTLAGLAALVAVVGPSDFDEAGTAFGFCAAVLPLFFAALFANEPPLPPRIPPRKPPGALRRLYLRTFGPGAAPTARFGAMLIVVGHLAIAMVVVVVGHLAYPGASHHYRADVAIVGFALGNALVCVCVLYVGCVLRVVLRNGIASRVLTLGLLFGACLLPLLVTLVYDARSLDNADHVVPPLLQISPLMPGVLAAGIADHGHTGRVVQMLVPIVVYGLLSLIFWIVLEQRVRAIAGATEALRARRIARLEERRALRPSLAPRLSLTSSPPPESTPEAGVGDVAVDPVAPVSTAAASAPASDGAGDASGSTTTEGPSGEPEP